MRFVFWPLCHTLGPFLFKLPMCIVDFLILRHLSFSPGSHFLAATSASPGGSLSTNIFGVWDVKRQVTSGWLRCDEYSNPRIILSKNGTTISMRTQGMSICEMWHLWHVSPLYQIINPYVLQYPHGNFVLQPLMDFRKLCYRWYRDKLEYQTQLKPSLGTGHLILAGGAGRNFWNLLNRS